MYTPLQPNQKNQGIPFSSKEAGIFLFWFVGEKSSPLTFDRNVWFGDVTSTAVTSNCFIDFDRVWIEQTQSCVFCPSLCLFCELAVSQTKLCSSVSFSPLDELDLRQSDDYFCFQLLLLIVELYIFVQAEHTTPQNRLKNNPRSGILDYIYMCSLIHYFHRLPLVLELQLEPQPFVRSNSIFYILP